MKISFTGTGSSGKSTLLKRCREYYGDRFEYIPEVTRPIARKGLKINEEGDAETQRAIIDAHIKNNKLDNVIMDRCIVDGAVYTTWLSLKNSNSVHRTVTQYAWNVLDEIVNDIDIIFHPQPVEIDDDGVRSINKQFQQEVHVLFNYTLYSSPRFKDVYKGKIISLNGDVENRFNDIKIAIEKHEYTAIR